MRTGLWSGYRVLQNRRPAGTSCHLCRVQPQPRPSVLILSELLIVLMNILEASRNESSGFEGMVSMALTANDPFNDQGVRRMGRKKAKSFNKLYINMISDLDVFTFVFSSRNIIY
ncbi:hypothetical protein AMECASPLE_006959 [Ameca splendens]|uniref:Uncharacterized protein n=1 Tax=Ameca splendens TaxID=208324 RepID=A0ABV0YLL2_9TELE